MSIESLMPSNHLILCHTFIFLPSIFPSSRVFSSESSLLIRWPRYRSFSFSISLSKEYSGSISFKIDWFDLLAFQGILKSLLQNPQLKNINLLMLYLLYYPALISVYLYRGFLGSSANKESAYNAGDPGLIPGQEDFLEKR